MKISHILSLGEKEGLERLDLEVLLSFVLGVEREFLYIHKDMEVSKKQEEQFFAFVLRRKKAEPVAYIIGEKEFYGRKFFVNRDVLIPRPETEELIDLVKKTLPSKDLSVLDLGTGSGVIAITMFLEGYSKVCASDISERALSVAQKNADRYHANIHFQKADLLVDCSDVCVDVIVANLPYVPSKSSLAKEVEMYEPHMALFSGEDGADLYKELVFQMKERKDLQYFFFEIDQSHSRDLYNLYEKNLSGFEVFLSKDLSGKERFLWGKNDDLG